MYFLFFIVQYLKLCVLADINDNIIRKCDQQENSIDQRDQLYIFVFDIRHHHQDDQAQEKYGGADLAGNLRAFEHSAFSESNDTGGKLKNLLDKDQNTERPKDRVLDG